MCTLLKIAACNNSSLVIQQYYTLYYTLYTILYIMYYIQYYTLYTTIFSMFLLWQVFGDFVALNHNNKCVFDDK